MVSWSEIAAFTEVQKNTSINMTGNKLYVCVCVQQRPGEKYALHHVEVLHQHISLRLGAQVAHRVTDAQLDGTFQGRGCGLWRERERERERERREGGRGE